MMQVGSCVSFCASRISCHWSFVPDFVLWCLVLEQSHARFCASGVCARGFLYQILCYGTLCLNSLKPVFLPVVFVDGGALMCQRGLMSDFVLMVFCARGVLCQTSMYSIGSLGSLC